MLIMPKKVQDKDILEFSPNITTERKIAISPNNNARIEEIIVDSKNKIVTKNCCIGYLINDQVDICNKMQIITDINSGKRISYNLSSVMPSYDNNYNLTQHIGVFHNEKELIMGKYKIKPHDKLYKCDYVTSCEGLTDFDHIYGCVFGAENLLQVDYLDLISVLEMFFTQWAFNAPFESMVIFDTEHCIFNIPKFTYYEKIISKDIALRLYADYAKELSALCNYLSELFNEVYGRKFRIMVYNNSFVTIIKIKDIEYKEMNLDLNVSASDHLNTLVRNRVACKWYCNNDALNEITDNKINKDITFDAMDTIDYINSTDIF